VAERFEILEEAGRGAMGVVYRARDHRSGKIVAVKMLRDVHADDPEYIARFEREVDLARQVRSPHIVRIRGYGARNGAPFVVMEFVMGRSLKARLQEGPVPPTEARRLLREIAEALAAVHAAGIIHRDVKSSNVLLTSEAVAKLTDFGIAHGGDARGSTNKGALLGTPAYLAPEGPVDIRSDLYSLGVVYYEMLSGMLPFTSSNYQEVILDHVNTPPDLTRIPPGERNLAAWLLEKDPSKRPQSAFALIGALNPNYAAPGGEQGTAHPTAARPPTASVTDPGPYIYKSDTSYLHIAVSRADAHPREKSSTSGRSAASALVVMTAILAVAAIVMPIAGGFVGPAPNPAATPVGFGVVAAESTGMAALVLILVVGTAAVAITITLASIRGRRPSDRPKAPRPVSNRGRTRS
jgi:serine/threonine protein kinase